MLTFESPAYLLLAALVPLGIYFRHFYRRRGGLVVFAFDSYRGGGFAPAAAGLRFVLFLCAAAFWAGCLCIILALAGPSAAYREKIYLNRGLDMMILIDESPSMAAQDFQPGNRFEVAKEVIRKFIKSRGNDHIGLVSFSQEAALRVPLTLDYAYLLERLDSLKIMDLGDGTAIGMGLAVASLHLKAAPGRERIMILLTDGKNNMGEILPETAADIASQLGIRIYAIGIGGADEAPLEVHDPRSGRTYRGTFQGGFDEKLIRGLAEKSGGAYFFAGSPGALSSVFQAIDSVERSEQRMRISVKSVPYYRVFIGLGLALVLFDFLIRKWLLREAA